MRIPCATVTLSALLIAACSELPAPASDAQGREPLHRSLAATKARSFEEWHGRPDQLLTLELAARIAGQPAEAAEKRTPPDAVRYRWPSPRSSEYAGMRIPKKNLVGLSGPYRGVTAAGFRARFLAETTDAQRARLDEQVAVETGKRGLDEGRAALARGLAAELLQKAPAEFVDQLGDAAAWSAGTHGNQLHLLVNGSLITIETDISDDVEHNKTAAIAIAEALLAQL